MQARARCGLRVASGRFFGLYPDASVSYCLPAMSPTTPKFHHALTIFLGLGQVEAESTSLLMIVIVAAVGAYRQNGYGNVRIREALIIGALSPLGVLVGVGVANHVSERGLQLSFAALALFMAVQLVRHARSAPRRED